MIKVVEGQKSVEIPVSNYCIVINSDDKEDITVYPKAYKYKEAFEEVWQKLFRPRHKHGYNVKNISDILDEETEDGPANKLMDELEKLYHEIQRDLED